MKGSYILLIKLKENKTIKVGKLGKLLFKKGFYVYIGSAMNNFEKRISRHFSKNKKFHWHVDYLLEEAKIFEVYLKENTIKEECKLANIFSEKLEKIPSFGCSDCKCESHMFYGKKVDILNLVTKSGMIEYRRRN